MTVVVHLKPRPKASTATLEAVDKAIGAEFIRLAERYGMHVVVTVAMQYITAAIVRTRLKRRPVEDSWLRDLAKRFDRAMNGEP